VLLLLLLLFFLEHHFYLHLGGFVSATACYLVCLSVGLLEKLQMNFKTFLERLRFGFCDKQEQLFHFNIEIRQ